jgi:hypothetical protein
MIVCSRLGVTEPDPVGGGAWTAHVQLMGNPTPGHGCFGPRARCYFGLPGVAIASRGHSRRIPPRRLSSSARVRRAFFSAVSSQEERRVAAVPEGGPGMVPTLHHEVNRSTIQPKRFASHKRWTDKLGRSVNRIHAGAAAGAGAAGCAWGPDRLKHRNCNYVDHVTKRTNTANTANGAFDLPPQLCENPCVWMQAELGTELLTVREFAGPCKNNLAPPRSKRRRRCECSASTNCRSSSFKQLSPIITSRAPARDHWLQNVDRALRTVDCKAHPTQSKPIRPNQT